ncbi:MAG TPA: branched-chain amino acid ABC transporter permease [Stellaceae bacterium]|jgi:branched-chain amino acid transport system permease protein|nr:branched-chain amino acid ABC transporter permease [Stellaceae bacterium]
MLAQQLLNGVVVGAVYALFSLGLTLVFGMHRILNLAHGAVFMWGALIGYFAVTLAGLPLWAAFIVAVFGAGLVSVALELCVFRPLRRHQGDEFGTIVASIGANLILMQLAQQATNAQTLRFPFGIFPILFYDIAGLRVSLQQLVILGAVAVIVVALLAFLFKTSLGSEARAVAVDERTSMLLGVNPGKVYLTSFLIAGMLAGAAGVILGVAFNSVSYVMGDAVMLQAFVVIVLGGLGSVTGAVLAGILIGMIQTLTTAYISTELSDAVVFGLLFVVLLIRPDGFFAGLHTEYRVA